MPITNLVPMTEEIRRRRRGEELENAILVAAWEELSAAGFANLTMESVAARARTGVAVLYRRWANKDELTLAAVSHYGRTRPVVVPDTGTLRGDLLELMAEIGDQRVTFATVVGAAFAGLLHSTGMSPAEIRDKLIEDQPRWSTEIFRRAHERGEIDLGVIPPGVLEMPFDLMRHDLLMTLRPPSPERITSIVDDMFLPLVANSRPHPLP
jgi:AcrR family transcriptional regulator